MKWPFLVDFVAGLALCDVFTRYEHVGWGEIAVAGVGNGCPYRRPNSGRIVAGMAKRARWVQQLFHIMLANRARCPDYWRSYLL